MPRIAVTVRGEVQGVGFRPFVWRAAAGRGLVGWVRNRADGVELEAQGPPGFLSSFLEELKSRAPAPARTAGLKVRDLPETPDDDFRILASLDGGRVAPVLPADLSVCPDCARETESPSDRRYGYPFTNCTRCGPRYTIIESLPYDRERTSMKAFRMCAACASEYENPADRRFHAEPVACPDCGPRVRLESRAGEAIVSDGRALDEAAAIVVRGGVLALKGLGGYQLLADAGNPEAVAELRRRKRRSEKPFAVMFADLESVRETCEATVSDASALASSESPILLLRRRMGEAAIERVAPDVAPGNPRIGAMLPTTPLHRLLLARLKRPVVCTSGNLASEPMCADDAEARLRLGGIADAFLVHDRIIVRPVDDSVARSGPDGLEVLRRARGYAPRALPVAIDAPPVLALGAHQKSTVTLLFDGQAVVSQHLGDLDSMEGVALLERTVRDLVGFFGVHPSRLACDLHPDYASTRLAEHLAEEWGVPLARVQHHHAHAAACAFEHGLDGEVLGIVWDGSGAGGDGTIWGGEALALDGGRFRRVATIRAFRLPGGDKAAREPRRAALGAIFEAAGPAAAARVGAQWFPETDLMTLLAMLARGANSPRTTSMGRLFDAFAALAGVRSRASFEGQAAMEFEFAAEAFGEAPPYPMPLGGNGVLEADWRPMLKEAAADLGRGALAGEVAARFHASLVSLAEAIAIRAGIRRVVLSGGCFQNAILSCAIRARLRAAGFEAHVPMLYPPNDGGVSLGQAVVAARASKGGA